MKNLQQVTEAFVVANLALRKAENMEDVESAQTDIEEAVSALCQLMGMDKRNLERFRLSDGKRRAA